MAKKASLRPSSELFNEVFGTKTRNGKLKGLKDYLDDNGSIFRLVDRGAKGLIEDYAISSEDAERFLKRANSLAIYLRRQFIEHTLTGKPDTEPDPAKSGLSSIVPGPTYNRLFNTPFDQLAPPEALESSIGLPAYLVFLWSWIRDHIEPHGDDKQMPMHTRRVDIKKLLVDTQSVRNAVSAVEIIIKILEAFINEHGDHSDLDAAMREARYPSNFPFDQDFTTIDTISRHHDLSVGHFARWTSLAYPDFLQKTAWDDDAGRALVHASRLGPHQRLLLTEDPVTTADKVKFYSLNFGTGTDYPDLRLLPFFGQRTGLNAQEVERHLSIRDQAPRRSDNVKVYPAPLARESHLEGSAYVNAREAPPMGVDYATLKFQLTEDPNDPARYDRMNRKLRLDRWLALDPSETDMVVMAAINADVRGGTPAHSCWITPNVVRALGMFQSLREGYGCSAREFATIMDGFGIYGREKKPAQFDEIFNSNGTIGEPMLLDDGEFQLLPDPDKPELTINRICKALSIDLKTYAYLAQFIATAHGHTDTLLRSRPILSAFYRLVKLPRLLKMTPVQGVLALHQFGGEALVNALAGEPNIKGTRAPDDTVPDALNAISMLMTFSYWCQTRALEASWVLEQVVDPRVLSVTTAAEQQLFDQVGNLLRSALLTHAEFIMAGAPLLVGRNWLDMLDPLTDPKGLVKYHAGTQEEYKAIARFELDKAIRDALGEENPENREPIVEKMLPVVLLARDAQVSVVMQSLAGYVGVDAERALRVVQLAGTSVYQILAQISEHNAQQAQLPQTVRNEVFDPLLILLATMRQRGAVVAKLDLSVSLLDEFVEYGYEAWLGQDKPSVFSNGTLYYLTVMTRALEVSGQPDVRLFDYLRQVHELDDPEKLSQDALLLAQQAAEVALATMFDWSVQDVRECAARIDPKHKLIKNLRQFDLFLRVRELARHTKMDARTIFEIGTLPEVFDRATYKAAADHAYLSLSESEVESVASTSALQGPLFELTISPDQTIVAAGSKETIVFTLTLKNQEGRALSGVRLAGKSSLGAIEVPATGVDGVAKAIFRPGKRMGQEQVLFLLPLAAPQETVPIQVTHDPRTLWFPGPLRSNVPVGIVPNGEEVQLFATLMDQYNNLGIGQLVRWEVEAVGGQEGQPVVRPSQGITNQEGLTLAYVSFPEGGTVKVSVRSEPSDNMAEFEPFTFAPPTA